MGVYNVPLVGESFGNRQNHILNAWEGQRVFLLREPRNKFDKNAVLVTLPSGKDLGYIGRDHNEWVAEIMDNKRPIDAKVKRIVGGYKNKKSLGVILEIYTGEDTKDFIFLEKKPSSLRGGIWSFSILLLIVLGWFIVF